MQLSELSFTNLTIFHFRSSIGFRTLVGGLKHSKNLRELNLRNSDIYNEDAELLAKNLKDCNSLEKINISDNDIPSSGIAVIFKSLKQCNLKINTAEITQGNVDDEFLKHLGQLTNLQSLTILQFHWIHFNSFCMLAKAGKNSKN